MYKKKYLPLLMAGCLFITAFPANVNAAPISASKDFVISDSIGTTKEPTKEALEGILTLVKSRITIPDELNVFEYNYNFNTADSSINWSLNWHNKQSTKYIYIQADEKGNILDYSIYNDKSGNYRPEFLKSELISTAKDFIKKAAPDIYSKIKYISADSQGLYNGKYIYKFERVENGIVMLDNTVYVGVNLETGKVESYNSNWLYDVEVPSSDVTITKEEAAKIIGKKSPMKLSYQSAYSTDANGNTKIKAFLVYSPDQSYIAVDAKTGEVYTTQNEWVNRNSYDVVGSKSTATKEDSASGLTKEEIKEIDGLKNIITSEEALKVIKNNKNLLLDNSMTSVQTALYKEYDYNSGKNNSKYVWNITMSDPRTVDYSSKDIYRANINASVDAQTGELISFNSNVKDRNSMTEKELKSIKVKYTLEQGQKIFEDFLKTQIPEKFKNSVLANNQGSYIVAFRNNQDIYGGYSYNYDRLNEGINYSGNGIYGSVDGVTGKIYSYSYNWNDNVTFESPKNIISASDAFDSYIANDGFTLAYEINNININNESTDMKGTLAATYSKEYEIRLVYRTDISPEYISPFTGKQMNYDGEEYKANDNSYSYSDINSFSSARNILLLADNGIGFAGGKYLPNQGITGNELKAFLTLVNIYTNSDKYQLKAVNTAVTRIEAAKYMIQILGYDNIATLKDIYNVNFTDKDKITTENLGYAAIAQGLKFVTASSNNEFRPNENLTRAEAADMLMAILSQTE